MENEDDESLAGLTQSTFLEPPSMPTCELIERIFEAQAPVTLYRITFRIGLPQLIDASATECASLVSDR